MPIIIDNLTDKPLWLRLNSGDSLSVMPRASGPELPDAEVAGNDKLEKLAEQRVIRVRKAGEAPEDADEPKSERRRGGAHRRNP